MRLGHKIAHKLGINMLGECHKEGCYGMSKVLDNEMDIICGKQVVDSKAILIMEKVRMGKEYTQDLLELSELSERYDYYQSEVLHEMTIAVLEDIRKNLEQV